MGKRSRQLELEKLQQAAHDLRSPLCALLMLLEEVEKIEFEKRRIVESAIKRALAIADDMLEHCETHSTE